MGRMGPTTFVGLDMHKRTTSVAIAEPGRGGELGEGIAVVRLAPARTGCGWPGEAELHHGLVRQLHGALGHQQRRVGHGPAGAEGLDDVRNAPAARPAGGARTRCSSWPARRGRSADHAETVEERHETVHSLRAIGPAAVPVALWQRCSPPTRSHGELAVHVRHAAAAGRHAGRRGALGYPRTSRNLRRSVIGITPRWPWGPRRHRRPRHGHRARHAPLGAVRSPPLCAVAAPGPGQ
jgi:hypothetical protein